VFLSLALLPPCCSWCFKSTPKEIKREARARAYPPPPLAVGSRIQLALAGRAGPYLLHVSNVPALSPWGHQIAVRLQGFALDIARGSGRVDKNIACTHVASACTHAPPPSVRTYTRSRRNSERIYTGLNTGGEAFADWPACDRIKCPHMPWSILQKRKSLVSLPWSHYCVAVTK
jgi:hypothetical protein